MALQKDMDAAKEFSDKYVAEQEQLAKQALIDQLQKEYEQDNKLKVGVEKILRMDTTAPKVKELILEEVIKSKSAEEKEQLKQEAKKEVADIAEKKANEVLDKKEAEIKTKVQNAVQEKIKNTLQKKVNTTNSTSESAEDETPSTTTIPPNASDAETAELEQQDK